MANVIVISLRRRRADTAETETFRRDLAELVLLTDDRLPETAASRILELAARHHLTAYDAAYLELAEHTRLPLATLDDALRRAATELGIPLV